MRKYLQLFPILLWITFLSQNKVSAQTVSIEINSVDVGLYSGAGSDCGDCISSPDPYVGVRFKHSGTGTWGGTGQSNRNDVGCDSYGGVGGYSASGIAWSGSTINVEIQGYESDGAVCAGDDGSCGLGAPSSGTNNLTIVAQPSCGTNNGQYSSNREDCASNGSTNDYRARWYYRWWYDAGSITAATTAGAIAGAANICDGGIATITNATSGTIYPRGTAYIQQSVNGGAYTTVATGTTNTTATTATNTLAYTSGALAVVGGAPTTYQFRRIVRYCTNNSGGTTDYASNVVTVNVVPDPNAPSATKNPNVTDVCVGTVISLTSPVKGSDPGQACSGFEYSINGGAYSGTASFTSTVGTNTIAVRVAGGCASGCNASPATTYSWNVVAQPGAPTTATKSPNVAAVCVGAPSLTISGVPSGGNAGVGCGFEYQYSIDGGTSWTFTGATVPDFVSVYPAGATKTNIIQARRASCQSGCTTSGWGTIATWTVVPDPSAPTNSVPSPSNASAQCEGTTLTLTGAAFGGTNSGISCVMEYQYSTDGGTSYTNTGTTIPSFSAVYPAGATKTNIIQARRINCLAGCDDSPWGSVSTWNIVPDPSAPTTATGSPSVAINQCEGTTLTLTGAAGGGTNLGVGCSIEYQYSTDAGVSWTNTGGTIPSFAAVYPAGATKTNIIQARRVSCQAGCDNSPWGTVATWTIVEDPTAPTTATKNPNVTTVCDGTTLTLAGAASGGITGMSCSIEYRFSTDNGSTWSSASTSIPSFSSVGILGNDNIIEARRNTCQSGCNAPTSWNEVARWSTVLDPDAPTTATKDPSDATVCSGTTLTLSVGASGGANLGVGCSIEYQYSTNNGSSWTNTGTSIPSFAAVTSANNIIQARRSACQTGCNTSSWATVASWVVVDQPAPGTLAKTPNTSAVCEGDNVSAVLTAGTGGAGTVTDVLEYRTDNGGGFTAWAAYTSSSNIPTSGLIAIEVRTYRTATVAGCNTSSVNSVSWVVVPQPVSGTLAKTPNTTNVCEGTSVSATLTAGSGGTGTVTDVIEYRFNGTGGWSSYTSGASLSTTGVTLVEIRTYRTATGPNCNTGSTNTVSWIVDVAPVATPNSVLYTCDGTASLNATGISGGSTISWEYVSGPVSPTGTSTSNPLLVTFSSPGTGVYNLLGSNTGCTNINLGTVNLVMPTTSTTSIASSASCSYCVVTDGNTRTFYNSSGEIIAKTEDDALVTPAALEETEICVRQDGSVQSITDNLGNTQPYLQRQWTVTPTNSTNATITFYFTNAELLALQAAANATVYQFSGYDLWVTKYPGGNNGSFTAPGSAGGVYVPATFSSYGSNHKVEVTVNSYSTFYVHPALFPFSALPVELTSFTGWNQGAVNRLQWITASEDNTLKFEVQKSTNNSAWTPIGEKVAAGNSNQQRNYDFTDNNPVVGNNYYRLKIIDNDGAFSYSNTINIAIGDAVTNNFNRVYPNPTNGQLNVEIQSTATYDTKVIAFDLIGKKVFEKSLAVNKGLNTLSFDFTNLPKGSYVLQFTDVQGKIHTTKFVKE